MILPFKSKVTVALHVADVIMFVQNAETFLDSCFKKWLSLFTRYSSVVQQSKATWERLQDFFRFLV